MGQYRISRDIIDEVLSQAELIIFLALQKPHVGIVDIRNFSLRNTSSGIGQRLNKELDKRKSAKILYGSEVDGEAELTGNILAALCNIGGRFVSRLP